VSPRVTVIGGGLAGTEAAFQLGARGIDVTLLEMRPDTPSPAHHSGHLAELVCSNSLKSNDPTTAAGMLKAELDALGSIVLATARLHAVAAGGALAVDRDAFSCALTAAVTALPTVEVVRALADSIPDGDVIVATGPLTDAALEPALSRLIGEERLAFYDAAAPIVDADDIDRSVCFAQSRYDKGEGPDYLNCPMDRDTYEAFVDALLAADRVHAKDFETKDLFHACMPVEEIARRGRDALRFGPMKPVGLTEPVTGRRPHAVVQLRAENRACTAYNLVGFQTNLTFPEQRRVFGMIPGIRTVPFLRYGVMHRNTFVDAPRLLRGDLALRSDPRVRIAGQLAGTEGYLEAAASGLIAALGLVRARADAQATPLRLPETTALGALLAYATAPDTTPYQPMHVNFGLMPPLDPPVKGKRERAAAYASRGALALAHWVEGSADLGIAAVRSSLARAVAVGARP
jgi:methylenetetrahydrofolate--tRNA-(uracil-5-)-methyltransferase